MTLPMVRTEEEAFHTTEEFVSVGRPEIEFLKSHVLNTSRKRIRLCLHKNVNDRLHEFFIIYTDKSIVEPHKHLAKDESMRVMEGEADLIFYNDQGDVTKMIALGAEGSGRTFYARVPADTYHTLVMKTEFLVLFVATPGPFIRAHTVWGFQ